MMNVIPSTWNTDRQSNAHQLASPGQALPFHTLALASHFSIMITVPTLRKLNNPMSEGLESSSQNFPTWLFIEHVCRLRLHPWTNVKPGVSETYLRAENLHLLQIAENAYAPAQAPIGKYLWSQRWMKETFRHVALALALVKVFT